PGVAHSEPVVLRVQNGLETNGNGDVEGVSDAEAMEARRSDANDFEGVVVECEAFPDDRRVAREIALPESVAQIRGTYSAPGLVIFWSEKASEDGLEAQHTEEVAADAQAPCVADFAAGSQVEGLVAPNGYLGEAFLTLANLLPHRKAQL